MTLNILILIIALTSIISYNAFRNQEMKMKMLFIPYQVKSSNEFYRIFSHMLIHADIGHLLFNMISLYFLGNLLLTGINGQAGYGLVQTYGQFLGQAHFLILYILGGMFASVIPYLRNQNNPSYTSLGASGAVSAVVFAAILWNPSIELQLLFIPIGIPAYIFGPLYILFEIFMDRRGGSGIAHDAHIGGALFGIIYILIINIEKGKAFIDLIF